MQVDVADFSGLQAGIGECPLHGRGGPAAFGVGGGRVMGVTMVTTSPTWGTTTDAASAYLFDRATGVELQKLLPTVAGASAGFGFGVGITSAHAVISAPFSDLNGTNAGLCEVYGLPGLQYLGTLAPNQPPSVAGNRIIDEAKIGGITPDMLSFSGRCEVCPP